MTCRKKTQRYFWACFYGGHDPNFRDIARMGRTALVAAYVCVQVLLLLLFLAYRFENGPYYGGDLFIFLIYEAFLTILVAILGYDHEARLTANTLVGQTCPGFTVLQGWFVVFVVLANMGMTIVSFVDVSLHPS